MANPRDRAAVLDIIEREAAESGIPRDDFLRFAYIETGGQFNADAHNRTSGAKGLFQFMPSTAAEFGLTGREFDAAANTDAAAMLYARNRTQITNRSAETGHAFLSGAERPNGLDMYLAHQQGGGGYASIQRAIATGEFSRSDTRTNILGNLDQAEFARITGHPRSSIAGLSDRDLATSFTEYWTAKYAAIEIPDRGIVATAPLPGARERANPLADGVLERGERGEDVRAMQQSLNELGSRDAQGGRLETNSGIYGQRTLEAVQSFQLANSLEQTGKADQATREAITAQLARPEAERTAAPPAQERAQGGPVWPAPGNMQINEADKPREGRGEFGTPRSRGKPHGGIDIEGNVGDPIVAFAGGRVSVAPNNGAAGNTVRIQHDDGAMTKYFHLDQFMVRHGQRVEAGQQIGTMGRTGNTPAQGDTHLHFELLHDGQRIDPLSVFGSGERPAADKGLEPPRRGSEPLRMGSFGAEVVALQERLNGLGHRGGDGAILETRSGVFGPQTDHALRAFQAERGIEIDGIFGEQSQRAIVAAIRSQYGSADLSLGDSGRDVGGLQERLTALGVKGAAGRPLQVDEIFGESTREAVLNFQRQQGIRPDGIAGPETFAKVGELTRGRSVSSAEQSSASKSSESRSSFVDRMLSAAKAGDVDGIRRVIEGASSSEPAEQWKATLGKELDPDATKANSDLQR